MDAFTLDFLFDIGGIIVAAAAMSYAARLVRQPPMVGYIAAGLLLGAFGLGVLTPDYEMLAMSELGISFLLFGAAVELNLNKLRGIGVKSVAAALVQVPLTALAGAGIFLLMGLSAEVSLLLGVIAAFSSTMVVMKVLQDTHRTFTLHARLEIALLIVQDILAILALAYLSSAAGDGLSAFAAAAAGGLGLFAIAIVLNRFVFPPLLKSFSRSTEVLFISSVALCFSFMWLAFSLGLSIAIGAFVAGISLSTFPYNLEVSGKMRSLRDFFAAIFFVILGAQVSPALGEAGLAVAVALTLFVLAGKYSITALAFAMLGFSARVASLAASGLAQISEFSFILALIALEKGIIGASMFSAVTLATIVTIVLTPFIARNEYGIYEFVRRMLTPLVGAGAFRSGKAPGTPCEEQGMEDHVVILGAHRMGHVLVEELKGENLLVVDYSPSVMDELVEHGVKAIYADAYSEETDALLDLGKAKALISTLPDVNVALAVVRRAKAANPRLKVLAKADFTEDAETLYSAGADLVIVPDLLAGEAFASQIKELLAEPSRLPQVRRRQVDVMHRQSNFGHPKRNGSRWKES
jgi:CPA2 family monovalent cation:H+ antiporter-2